VRAEIVRCEGFEVFTVVVMKSIIFWNMTPCSPLSYTRRFGATYRLHLQCRRIVQQTIEWAGVRCEFHILQNPMKNRLTWDPQDLNGAEINSVPAETKHADRWLPSVSVNHKQKPNNHLAYAHVIQSGQLRGRYCTGGRLASWCYCINGTRHISWWSRMKQRPSALLSVG
jgi:hypothetical protein